MRVLALLLLFAVMPTAELVEQGVHLVEHLVAHEEAAHSAHHDEDIGDEHGCTGLVHLCGHHTQVTAGSMTVAIASVETPELVTAALPVVLVDLHSLEPPQRPPIA